MPPVHAHSCRMGAVATGKPPKLAGSTHLCNDQHVLWRAPDTHQRVQLRSLQALAHIEDGQDRPIQTIGCKDPFNGVFQPIRAVIAHSRVNCTADILWTRQTQDERVRHACSKTWG